jgi:hypothetical protein
MPTSRAAFASECTAVLGIRTVLSHFSGRTVDAQRCGILCRFPAQVETGISGGDYATKRNTPVERLCQ